MNLQSIHHAIDLSHGAEVLMAWLIAMCSMAIYATFAPYVAHDQARQLVLCLGGLCGVFVLARVHCIRKKIVQVKELHCTGFHSSAA